MPSEPADSCPRRHLTSTTSTNAEAFDWARENGPDGAWVTAEEQTAGRGRAGRGWHSPRGNLYASVILRDPGPRHQLAQLGFVCGVALHDSICNAAPELNDRVRLKWPNDMLVDGRKFGGILLENYDIPSRAGRPMPVVIAGFGVNLTTHPDDAPYPVTNLLDLGVDEGPDVIWKNLRSAVGQWRTCWQRDGFEPVRQAWMERAQGIGRPVTARLPDGGVFKGIFRGIDERGTLELVTADGAVHHISTADILFGAPKQSVA